jgi:hypothetical protein
MVLAFAGTTLGEGIGTESLSSPLRLLPKFGMPVRQHVVDHILEVGLPRIEPLRELGACRVRFAVTMDAAAL